MVKHYILLIILLSICYVHNENEGTSGGTATVDGKAACEEIGASSVNECVDKISQSYKNSGYHCCLQKGKKGDNTKTICRYLTEDEYDNIKDYIGDIKDAGYKDVSVDCKSYYLQIGILSLLLFLL